MLLFCKKVGKTFWEVRAVAVQCKGVLILQRQYNIFALNRSETAERQVALWQGRECTARVYRYDALCPKHGSNRVKKDGRSCGKRQYKCNQCGKKRQEGAKHRFIDDQKAQAAKMRAEGMSLSATPRVMGASVPTVSKWVKKGGIGDRASDAISGVAYKR